MTASMSQSAQILRHLRQRGSITPLEALRLYGSFRLGARIYELRKTHTIESRLVSRNGKKFAEYRLS